VCVAITWLRLFFEFADAPGCRNWLRRIRFFSAGNADGAMLMERGAA
jgi:hypothetical protein